jgi:hypothetical protein
MLNPKMKRAPFFGPAERKEKPGWRSYEKNIAEREEVT